MNELTAMLGFVASFCLFLDNIDVIFDKKVSNTYKAIRTLCIVFVMLIMLHMYFVWLKITV
jgi:hypothetical protein